MPPVADQEIAVADPGLWLYRSGRAGEMLWGRPSLDLRGDGAEHDRPPLQPGEWRTLGLFDAEDYAHLERVLATMPSRVWRNDEVTPLFAHPNDPAQTADKPNPAGRESGGSEFLTMFVVSVPQHTTAATVDATTALAAVSARAAAADGHLLRLWKLAAQGNALGLWRAPDIVEMRTMIASLPLIDWMSVQITPLSPHPSDPALTGS